MSRPRLLVKVTTERVQAGRWLVDCTGCGTVGVWRAADSARRAKAEHVCGRTSTVPGKWGPLDRIGGFA